MAGSMALTFRFPLAPLCSPPPAWAALPLARLKTFGGASSRCWLSTTLSLLRASVGGFTALASVVFSTLALPSDPAAVSAGAKLVLSWLEALFKVVTTGTSCSTAPGTPSPCVLADDPAGALRLVTPLVLCPAEAIWIGTLYMRSGGWGLDELAK